MAGDRTSPWAAHPVVTYNLLRVGLLVAALALGYLAGLRGVLLVLVALVVSGVFSWFLLARQRMAMGQAVQDSVERRRQEHMQKVAAEDAYADELRRRQQEHDSSTPEG